jgi:FdrA protein
VKRVLVEPNRYFDSVFLMRIGREIERLAGVRRAIVAIGTRANLSSLAVAGFAPASSAEAILPSDLMIALDAESDGALDAARARLDELLAGAPDDGAIAAARPGSLREALESDPRANLALISVPGEYAAREARLALRRGLHVMLFSNNVSLDDEIALKKEAIERGLLMMGPDCGTAILNGVPLGFANVVRRGTIGIVGASGTGIQEISSLVHRFGGGISQAIGTGGRDLSSEVGAAMTRFGIDALAQDPRTEVLVVVSKAPAACAIPGLLERLEASGKPAVVQFVGFDPEKADPAWLEFRAQFATTLEEAARTACAAAGVTPSPAAATDLSPADSTGGRLVGLYCGGTLCQEAWSLMRRAGADVVCNVAFDPAKKVRPEARVVGHVLWDLGDDVFTVGKPHPMIEPSLRDGRVAQAGEDPGTGIVLADCIIGHGAHEDPGGSLARASRDAMETARAGGRRLIVVASVTGTDLDPQDATRQRRELEDAGVLVAESNAAAVRTTIALLRGEGR